ncbi:hypothetical protein Tco_0272721 [Tanacetum coccineum]
MLKKLRGALQLGPERARVFYRPFLLKKRRSIKADIRATIILLQRFSKLIRHEKHQDEPGQNALNSTFVNNMLLNGVDNITRSHSTLTDDPLALVSNAQNQKYPTQSSESPQSSNQPSIVDNCQMDTGSTSTDNLIESLTNTLALLNQSFKAHLPQMNNQLRTSSNARNNATVQDRQSCVQDALSEYVKYYLPNYQYMEDNEEHVVQSNVSSIRNDALMSILDEMHEHGVQSRSANKQVKVVNDTLTSELADIRNWTGTKQIWQPKGKLFDNSLKKTKQVWKATGKLFANVGYQWRPIGKKFTPGKLNCGYQWRPTGKKFALGERELVPRPIYVMVIALKWIYKVKLDEYGDVLKNKARLVAKGYRQEEEEVFGSSDLEDLRPDNPTHVYRPEEGFYGLKWHQWRCMTHNQSSFSQHFLQDHNAVSTYFPKKMSSKIQMSMDGTNVVFPRTNKFLKTIEASFINKQNILSKP